MTRATSLRFLPGRVGLEPSSPVEPPEQGVEDHPDGRLRCRADEFRSDLHTLSRPLVPPHVPIGHFGHNVLLAGLLHESRPARFRSTPRELIAFRATTVSTVEYSIGGLSAGFVLRVPRVADDAAPLPFLATVAVTTIV